MEQSLEMQGATREEAVQKALEALGLDRDQVSVEILETGKKGFLGFGSTKARVRVTYDSADVPADKLPELLEQEPTEPITITIEKEPEVVEATIEEKEIPISAPVAEVLEELHTEVTLQVEPPLPADETQDDSASTVADRAIVFLDGLLAHMGVQAKAELNTITDEGTVKINLVGAHMGLIIGRRGETLDAIQYLTGLAANKGRHGHIRVQLDTENYRAKRDESLVKLAHKMAHKVQKYRRSMALEPMNPYERRVIHAALQDVEGITTHSTGTEPNRRVIVSPAGGYRSYTRD